MEGPLGSTRILKVKQPRLFLVRQRVFLWSAGVDWVQQDVRSTPLGSARRSGERCGEDFDRRSDESRRVSTYRSSSRRRPIHPLRPEPSADARPPLPSRLAAGSSSSRAPLVVIATPKPKRSTHPGRSTDVANVHTQNGGPVLSDATGHTRLSLLLRLQPPCDCERAARRVAVEAWCTATPRRFFGRREAFGRRGVHGRGLARALLKRAVFTGDGSTKRRPRGAVMGGRALRP